MMSTEREMVILAGLARTGKTSVAEHLAEDHGFTRVSVSGFIRDLLVEAGGDQEFSRDDYARMHESIRQPDRDGVDAIVNRILAVDADRLVIDGLRNSYDALMLRRLRNARLIGLRADLYVRFLRDRSADDEKTADNITTFDSSDFVLAKNRLNDINTKFVVLQAPSSDVVDTTYLTPEGTINKVDSLLGYHH